MSNSADIKHEPIDAEVLTTAELHNALGRAAKIVGLAEVGLMILDTLEAHGDDVTDKRAGMQDDIVTYTSDMRQIAIEIGWRAIREMPTMKRLLEDKDGDGTG